MPSTNHKPVVPNTYYNESLTGAITDSALTIPVSNPPTKDQGVLVLEPSSTTKREVIYYTSKDATNVYLPSWGRGLDGTTATDHADQAVIVDAPTPAHLAGIVQGLLEGYRPTDWAASYASASSIVVTGNVTTDATVGRKVRVKFATTGIRHFRIASSSFSTNTTINLLGNTVVNEVIDYVDLDLSPQNNASDFAAEHNADGSHKIDKLDGVRYAADAGGDDTYEVTLTPTPTAYYAGMEVNFRPTTANTGACTLDVNGLGAKTIKKNVSTDLATGDILSSQMVKVIYDGTNFQLVSNIPIDATGWNTYSAVIPTRASADDPTYVLTFAGVDLTSILSVGMRVKWTQNSTVRYAIITAISFSTNTTLTLYGGTDYDVDDTATFAISGFAYSLMKSPLGFPLDPTKWTATATDSSMRTQATPTQNTWYNPGTITLAVPIGAWKLSYLANVDIDDASASTPQFRLTLSTANNSESDATMTAAAHVVLNASSRQGLAVYREKFVTLATKTSHYLNIMTPTASVDNLNIRGDIGTTVIRAVCAYL